MRISLGRLLLIAISWANLSFIGQWAALNEPAGVYVFWRHSQSAQQPVQYMAATIGCLAFALFIWLVLLGAQRAGSRGLRAVSRAVLVLLTCLTVNKIEVFLFGDFGVSRRLLTILPIPFLAWFIGSRRLMRSCAVAAVVAAPFAAWTLGRAGLKSMQSPSVLAAPRIVPLSAAHTGGGGQVAARTRRRRVLWIVFDEWDGALTFDRREPALSLPALDEFRATSFRASAAQAPATATTESMPSLLTGRRVEKTYVADSGDLMMRFRGADGVVGLHTYPHLVQALRERSASVAIAGWYLPYCRMFDGLLSACYSVPFPSYTEAGGGLSALAVQTLVMLLPDRTRPLLGYPSSVQIQQRLLDSIAPVAVKYAADPGLDFVLLHLPEPHPPVLAGGPSGRPLNPAEGPTYSDNLALVDRMLRVVEVAMKRTGVWGDTSVLLSSDHWFRDVRHSDAELYNKVPFLLKLPGEMSGACYDLRFNTVVTGSLLLAIFDGKVHNTGDAARWLTKHRSVESDLESE